MPTAIVDSGAVIALADSSDPQHERVTASLAEHVGTILLPDPVIMETAFLLGARRGPRAEAAFVARASGGSWRRISLQDDDLRRAAQLIERYADARLGFVDAAIIALAERLAVTRIYTLDRRDFGLVRPRHVEAFEILP
jgi:predicted nucleic acid-binding protein